MFFFKCKSCFIFSVINYCNYMFLVHESRGLFSGEEAVFGNLVTYRKLLMNYSISSYRFLRPGGYSLIWAI